MSAEEILLSQARSYMFTSKVQQFIQDEIIKGCSPELYPQPVALEPSYEPLARRADQTNGTVDGFRSFFRNEGRYDRFKMFIRYPAPQLFFSSV